MRPEPPHAREVVLELRQLDLQLALGAVRVVGEDVEDHRGAVDHRHAQLGFEIAFLARRQLVVGRDEVGVGPADRALELVELAAAQVAVGVGIVAVLDQLARGRDAGGAQQLLELGQRVLVRARRSRVDAHDQRPLARAPVLDARFHQQSAGGFASTASRFRPMFAEIGERADPEGVRSPPRTPLR